mmetsp:Transcript_7087/g.29249  ORF Transcript_7087/g.29249 Transcript_7087/m.29249 type:complete len:366 (-) Transcript_7087:1885-2982(-)
MCTPTFKPPSGSRSQCNASSRSRAVGGSIETTRVLVKSRRVKRSRSGTVHRLWLSPVAGSKKTGTSGRHRSASSENAEAPRTACSATSAAVAVARSSASPRTSVTTQLGCVCAGGQLSRRATTRLFLSVSMPFADAAATRTSGGNAVSRVSTRIKGSFGSEGKKRSAPAPPAESPSARSRYPVTTSRRGDVSCTATTRPTGRRGPPATPPERAASARSRVSSSGPGDPAPPEARSSPETSPSSSLSSSSSSSSSGCTLKSLIPRLNASLPPFSRAAVAALVRELTRFASAKSPVAAAASAARTEPTTTPSSMTLRCFGGGGTLLRRRPAQRSTPAEASAFRTAANEGDGAAPASAPETSTRATST